MRIKNLLVCVLVGFSSQLFAQVDSSAHYKRQIIYVNNFLAGGLIGKSEQGTGFSFSTTHGIRLNRLGIGAGIGFDSYLDWKTLPVFGSISFDFAKVKRNAFFIQFNAGYANAWRIKEEVWPPINATSGGRMIHYNVGYRIKANRFSLYISAGHKFQRVQYSYNPNPWSFGPESKVTVDQSMNRMFVQIGFGLN